MKTVTPNDGIVWTHEIPVLPKWFEMQEGAAVPAVKRGFEIGPRGQSRNAMFKRGTTKTQRPAVRFDLCTKCTLCWVECPDECFDPTSDGYYDIEYQYCVGCGKCAEICPVKECIVMVDELQFEDDHSPWEHWKKDSKEYIHVGRREKRQGACFLSRRNRQGHHRYSGTSDARGKDRTRQKDGGG